MTREGRYWLFFVIVAVGLALSWGQVGRKTERALGDRPLVLLETERPCRPLQAPCAAVGRDRALVLGPAEGGLALRITGIAAGEIIDLTVSAERAEGDPATPGRPRRSQDRWSIPSPSADVVSLRIIVQRGVDETVADFPL